MGRERRRRKGERKWEKGQWGEGEGEKKREKKRTEDLVVATNSLTRLQKVRES